MAGLRRTVRGLIAAAAFAAALAAACRPIDDTNTQDRLERGEDFARTLAEQNRRAEPVERDVAVALGYLERLRLGLGSPFRLMDYALHDSRLAESTRKRLVWALLGRTADGRAYRVNPAALDRVGMAWTDPRPGIGRAHLRLIEDAVAEARDPRTGELAVRLAYALAAVEESVDRWAFRLAVQTAAMVRDRELARADARALLRAARAGGEDPEALVPAWRARRRFQVEQPPLAVVAPGAERDAIELAPRLAATIRALRPGRDGRDRNAASHEPAYGPLLGPAAAARLIAAADSLNAPPQTPVVIAANVHRGVLMRAAGPDESRRAALRRFLRRATNEERFAAGYALLAQREGIPNAAVARTALWTAVGLRTYAQERVWLPGRGGPSRRELEDRYELAAVRFDDDVPGEWRPYYRRMLERSLADLTRVLPALKLRGLTVRFGDTPRRTATLALHEPKRRVITLPPETGAGAIAHEIAHDLDWQTALRRYRVWGDYATDHAVRQRRGHLASALQRLTTMPMRPPAPGAERAPMHESRPAEIFARGVDWFVVAALAAEGRINGYLSSVQDDVLTGYGTVIPPDVTGVAGGALVSILDDIAPVHAETRQRFLGRYGPGRPLTAYDLVRRMTEVARTPERDAHGSVERELAAVADAHRSVQQAIDAWVCRAPGAAYDSRLERARRTLVRYAARAQARGVAMEHAAGIAGREGRRWLARRFYGMPGLPASVSEEIERRLKDVSARAATLDVGGYEERMGGFQLSMTPPRCAVRPVRPAD